MTILDHLMSLLCVCVCVCFYEVHLQRVTAYKIESIFQLKFLPYSIWPWFLDKSTLVKWHRLCCSFQSHKGSWSLHAMFGLHTYLPLPLPPHPAPQVPESRAGFSFPSHPSLTQHSYVLLMYYSNYFQNHTGEAEVKRG